MAEGITAHRTSVLVLMLMLLMAVSASSIANAQDADDSEGPGITWELPENHMLYMKGTEQQPFLDRNWTTNTGEPLGRETHQIISQNTVYLDRNRPSQIILPVIPPTG